MKIKYIFRFADLIDLPKIGRNLAVQKTLKSTLELEKLLKEFRKVLEEESKKQDFNS